MNISEIVAAIAAGIATIAVVFPLGRFLERLLSYWRERQRLNNLGLTFWGSPQLSQEMESIYTEMLALEQALRQRPERERDLLRAKMLHTRLEGIAGKLKPNEEVDVTIWLPDGSQERYHLQPTSEESIQNFLNHTGKALGDRITR